jgi:hypothetical protein
MDLSGRQIEGHRVKDLVSGKELTDIPHLKDTAIRFTHIKSFLQLYENNLQTLSDNIPVISACQAKF